MGNAVTDPFPTLSDLLGHDFDNIDGKGLTHRQWMANVGAVLNGLTGSGSGELGPPTSGGGGGGGDVKQMLWSDGVTTIDWQTAPPIDWQT